MVTVFDETAAAFATEKNGLVNTSHSETTREPHNFKSSYVGLKLTHNYLCIYSTRAQYQKEKQVNEESIANLEKAYTAGDMTRKAAKRLQYIVQEWAYICEEYNKNVKFKKGEHQRKLTFVTLTFPVDTFHTDQVIKQKMLNYFLKVAARKWKANRYVWRAERTKADRLHFHIVFDRYIDKNELNNEWNNILDLNGYIEKYYNYTGKKNPPSTNIEVVKSADAIGAYCSKYMTKRGESDYIEGHVWGCCDELRSLRPILVEPTTEEAQVINQKCEEVSDNVVHLAYSTIIYIKNVEEAAKYIPDVVSDFLVSRFNNYKHLFAKEVCYQTNLFE